MARWTKSSYIIAEAWQLVQGLRLQIAELQGTLSLQLSGGDVSWKTSWIDLSQNTPGSSYANDVDKPAVHEFSATKKLLWDLNFETVVASGVCITTPPT